MVGKSCICAKFTYCKNISHGLQPRIYLKRFSSKSHQQQHSYRVTVELPWANWHFYTIASRFNAVHSKTILRSVQTWLSYNLTHWGRDKMAAIFQTKFSNAYSWIKMLTFLLRFHWSLFPRVQLTIFKHWFRWWLGAGQATSHFLNQWWLVYWRMYASLGLNELTHVLHPHDWAIQYHQPKSAACIDMLSVGAQGSWLFCEITITWIGTITCCQKLIIITSNF